MPGRSELGYSWKSHQRILEMLVGWLSTWRQQQGGWSPTKSYTEKNPWIFFMVKSYVWNYIWNSYNMTSKTKKKINEHRDSGSPKLKNTGEKKIDRVLWTWGSMAQPVGKAIWLVATQIFLECSPRTLGVPWSNLTSILLKPPTSNHLILRQIVAQVTMQSLGKFVQISLWHKHWPFSRHFCLPPGEKVAAGKQGFPEWS